MTWIPAKTKTLMTTEWYLSHEPFDPREFAQALQLTRDQMSILAETMLAQGLLRISSFVRGKTTMYTAARPAQDWLRKPWSNWTPSRDDEGNFVLN